MPKGELLDHGQLLLNFELCFFHGSTTLEALALLYEASRSHSDTSHSLGLLSTKDRPAQRTLLDRTQHSQETDIHALAGIRTRSPNKRKAADPSLRPRGHRGR